MFPPRKFCVSLMVNREKFETWLKCRAAPRRAACITTTKQTILFTFPDDFSRFKGNICDFSEGKGFLVISEQAILQIPPAWISRVIAVTLRCFACSLLKVNSTFVLYLT